MYDLLVCTHPVPNKKFILSLIINLILNSLDYSKVAIKTW